MVSRIPRRGSLISLLVLLLSCAAGETPRQAAQGYLEALEALDFAKATQYVAEEGQGSLRALKELYQSLAPEEQAKFRLTGWTLTQESQLGDTAVVNFAFDEVKKGQLLLKRVRGVWKVEQRSTF